MCVNNSVGVASDLPVTMRLKLLRMGVSKDLWETLHVYLYPESSMVGCRRKKAESEYVPS